MNLVREVKSAYLTKEIKRLWPKDPKSHKAERAAKHRRDERLRKIRAKE